MIKQLYLVTYTVNVFLDRNVKLKSGSHFRKTEEHTQYIYAEYHDIRIELQKFYKSATHIVDDILKLEKIDNQEFYFLQKQLTNQHE